VITISELWRKLSNRKYRAAFARTQFKRLVPLQIQTLRKQRGWSQEELAEKANLTQGVISRAEDQDYGNLTVNTILSVAEGLDVAFVGRFVPFSELDRWYVKLSKETMRVPSFDEESEAMIAGQGQQNVTDAIHTGLLVGIDDERFGNRIIPFEHFEKERKEIGLLGNLLNAESKGESVYAAVSGSSR